MPTLAEYMQQAGLNDLSDPQRGGTGWAKTFRDWLTSDPSSRYGSVLPVASSTQYSNPTYLDAQGRAIHGMEVPYQERRLAMPSIGSETIGNLVNYADAPRAAAMGEFDPNTPENIEMLARGAFDAGAGGMLFNKAPAGSLRSGAIRTSTPSIEDTLRAKYPDIELDLYGDANRGLTLSKIAVPENMRDAGIGTAVMDDIIRMADAQGARLQLTPDAVYGGNVGRLKDFYKRFDFLPNKGRNKDFGTMESMVRQPQGVALTAQEQQAQSILDLLTSGNAASVTDDMLAAADQKYLYDNYDLPMDEASRLARAKDMGFGDDMYHGSTHVFDDFSGGPTKSVEGHFGAGNYLTSDFDDANVNYAGMGPDLTGRVERRAEQLADEMGLEYNDPQAFSRAKAELSGETEGVIYPVRAKGNTVDVRPHTRGRPTTLEIDSPNIDDFMDEAIEELGKEADEWDIRSLAEEKAYEDAAYRDQTGTLADFVDSIRNSQNRYEFDADEALEPISENMMDYAISADDLDRKMRGGLAYVEDDMGNLAGNEVLRKAFEDAGYGNIKMDAASAFPNMDINPGTLHEIISDPSNIRSQFARFDPRLSHLSNLSASGMNPLAALAAHIEQARRENQMMQLNR